jgi:hypothetical protein
MQLEVALEATSGWLFVAYAFRQVDATVHLAEAAGAAAQRGNKKRAGPRTSRTRARLLWPQTVSQSRWTPWRCVRRESAIAVTSPVSRGPSAGQGGGPRG